MNWPLIIALAVPLLGGYAVGQTIKDDTKGWWYEFLRKPSWMPSPKVFGPVWAVLYIMMGLASYLVYLRGGDLTMYGLQLALNLWWSILFFQKRDLRGASAEILVLLASILATMWSFAKADTTAALLMAPYAAWTAFAAALTLTVTRLNPSSSERYESFTSSSSSSSSSLLPPPPEDWQIIRCRTGSQPEPR